MDDKITLISELQKYQVCQSCGIVDQDNLRTQTCYLCPRCNTPSNGGLKFFNLETQMLADLIRDTWENRASSENSKRIDLTLIIFYCTLQEILMHKLLGANMWALGIPDKLIDKILSDNRDISRRIYSLFPVLTGEKFNKVVLEEASTKEVGDQLLNVWKKAIDARNSFMHQGDQWGIPQGLPGSCWKSVLPLCDLFVRLTNKYATKKVRS